MHPHASGEETHSIWMTEPAPQFPVMPGDLKVDVAIIGAGMTGITTALMLKRRGRKVAVIDAATVGAGETSRTSAHLAWALDARISTLRGRFGREATAVAVRAHAAAIDWMERTAADLRIECDFLRVPGFLYCDASDEAGLALLEEEAEATAELGLETSWQTGLPLPFPVGRALLFPNQAQFHPLRYLYGLAGTIPGDGSAIYGGTRVLSVDDGEPCRVTTERGTITCEAVVVAAHVPISNRVFMHTKLEPMRTYVLAVPSPVPLGAGLFWDTAEPYHYWRTVQSEGETLMLVGGADHKVGESHDTEAAFRALESYVNGRLGGRPGSARAQAIKERWSGQIIEPVDGLAYVGRNSLSTRVFVATGYSGNGLTGATAAAMILADEVNGTPHPWSDVFAATRITPVASAKAFVRHNTSAAKHLVTDRFKTTPPRELADLAAGEGRVVELGGEKLAVYRDPVGALRALSAVCTHLGCLVAWNNAEQSWDCPCHGSRFSPEGDVVNGPAVSPLERRDLLTLVDDQSAEEEAATAAGEGSNLAPAG
jgi:glycine/D-amino acid oxidase-like deaminating enzyme/nitrite reductase/ring-hydroxylating ferredoxin subunit